MHLSRLRLAGFKSFVEECELAFAPGLTGIVGPNGCGKSNLVEALRWVMGENSPRRMRGGEMDDVIFNGTVNRSPRNIAEVALLLDNAAFDAPNPFNDEAQIEVLRRIERQGGSTYRINGHEVRARDVQLLFADAASGAKSASLVGQGRVGELINAKPNQRRHLLEEAAGIAGLQSRRHEAELRLRAAETNLARVADFMGQLQTQLDGLKRQARQAGRYRRLSARIRDTEARLLEMRWRAAEAAWAEAGRRMDEAERNVARLTLDVARTARERDTAAEALEPARLAEASAGVELHRLGVARVALDADAERLREAERELRARQDQTVTDLERETALVADADASLDRLAAEADALEAEQARDRDARDEAAARRDEAQAAVAAREAEVARLTSERMAREERRGALGREIADLDARVGALARRAEELAVELDAVAARDADVPALETVRDAAVAADGVLETAREALTAATATRTRETEATRAAEASLREAEAALARLDAERAALAHVLNEGPGAYPPVINRLDVQPGYEAALGAALGDELEATLATEAPVHWRAMPPIAPARPLPAGAVALAMFVEAPIALARRLGQTGVIEGKPDGDQLAALAPGQRLVNRAGDLWRWDGFTATGGVSGAATKLRQRNRLTELAPLIEAATAGVHAATASAMAASETLRVAAADEDGARERVRRAEADHNRAHLAVASRAADVEALATRRAALVEHRDRVAGEHAGTADRLGRARDDLAAVPAPEDGDEALATARTERDAARDALARRMAALEAIVEAERARARRLGTLGEERESWTRRAEGARRRAGELDQRLATTRDELARLAERPAQIEAQRLTLLESIATAERARDAAADARVTAEAALRAADRVARAAERAMAEAREERVRAEGLVEQARTVREELNATIGERLGVEPERLGAMVAEAAETGVAEAEATVQDLNATLQKMLRERDAIGPVNLRAEIEAEEVEQQLGAMTAERTDLEAAINRLRRGIVELNREGRDRLNEAFKVIDGHFQGLFARLFAGGSAHLELIDAEDPLEAGLEIVASPPGKKLQTLSLLSGGEQALTALALIFAQFATNPSPVCVLDEVDAPLDDPNVDRFCTLLSEIALQGATRFLVITHHPMTMARMDRLFGVTMAERGVSQLVSVDLAQADRLRATA
ncbi:MAG: chromosome segregation protein SMC [Alphaproteobacteria bacterium]|nr:chromosome segregation protein SMC [Alphaproteobacteria bacterium]